MEVTTYYVIISNIPVDWIGHMISWLCMYFVIFPSNYMNRVDRLKLKLSLGENMIELFQRDSVKQLVVYRLHWI